MLSERFPLVPLPPEGTLWAFNREMLSHDFGVQIDDLGNFTLVMGAFSLFEGRWARCPQRSTPETCSVLMYLGHDVAEDMLVFLANEKPIGMTQYWANRYLVPWSPVLIRNSS